MLTVLNLKKKKTRKTLTLSARHAKLTEKKTMMGGKRSLKTYSH